MKKKKALILGSSKGIGKAIYESLKELNLELIVPKREILDTSNLSSVKKYIKIIKNVHVLVMNTGGPPVKNFFLITDKEWDKYYHQLFLSFVIMLQKLNIDKNGFIFLISSHTIKSPEENLCLSNSYRVALSSILKTVSQIYAKKNITCINIAPGPIKTNRLKKNVKNIKELEKKLPMKRAGNPKEIGDFIKSIIKGLPISPSELYCFSTIDIPSL